MTWEELIQAIEVKLGELEISSNSLSVRQERINSTGFVEVCRNLRLGLVNLNDDHSLYALLAGRSGGQVLKGGIDSSDDLTLQSTDHATKGKILFGTSAYDEVNNRLGLNDSTPSYTLDVNGTIRCTGISYLTGGIRVQGDAIVDTLEVSDSEIHGGDNRSLLTIYGGDSGGGGHIHLHGSAHANSNHAYYDAKYHYFRDTDGSPTGLAVIGDTGFVGIGEENPDAPLEVSTAADVNKQAVTIDQNDLGLPFIDYQGDTGASDKVSISTFPTAGALQGWVQIEINGAKRWMPFYDTPSA